MTHVCTLSTRNGRSVSVVSPGAAADCEHCAGTTSQQERERALIAARAGGRPSYYEITRHARLAHALVRFK